MLLVGSYHYLGPNLHVSLLDLLKGQHSPVPDSVIICCPHNEVPRYYEISILSQYKHWFNCPDDHNIFCNNAVPIYYFNFLRFYPFGGLGCCKTGLGVGVFLRWGEGYKLCFLETIDDYKVRGDLKRSPYFHQYIINVRICELQVSMLSLSVHSGLIIEPLQLEVWPIIIWLVIS